MHIISDTLAAVHPAAALRFRNLTMYPLIGGASTVPDYLTLDEALVRSAVRVTEVSEAGAVPELRLENSGDLAVLLLDGEELTGAKQNRILNLSILAPARESIVVPVSCVEAGRWHHTSDEFHAAPRAHYARGRGRKAAQVSDSMRDCGTRRSNQSEVWEDIDIKSRRMEVESPTAAMEAMYSHNAVSIDAFVAALPAADGQLGAAFEINGALVGIDLFDHPATLAKLLPKLVRSYALDALDEAAETEETKPAVEQGVAALDTLIGRVAAARFESFPAVGEGTDLRIEAAGLAGGALVARGRTVHLCAFVTEDSFEHGAQHPYTARMARASRRRRNH